MIGIIGFGRFGRLAAGYLAGDCEVLVFARSGRSARISAAGARPASFEEVCRQDLVIPCVPISSLPRVLTDMAPFLKKGALVADVCSVKVMPVRWMQERLPADVSILATHPMFGPDSARRSLQGCKIFLSRVRGDEGTYAKIKAYLAAKGLTVIEGTPEEHDRQIAVSLALTHFIGRALSAVGARPLDMDTEGYRRLLAILDVVEHDTDQLFCDMHRYNPFAEEKRIAFMQALNSINEHLKA